MSISCSRDGIIIFIYRERRNRVVRCTRFKAKEYSGINVCRLISTFSFFLETSLLVADVRAWCHQQMLFLFWVPLASHVIFRYYVIIGLLSSMVEYWFCKPNVIGSSPIVGYPCDILSNASCMPMFLFFMGKLCYT